MLGFLSLCLMFTWDTASGQVDYYHLYRDYNAEEILLTPVYQGVTVCFHDQLPHVIAVQAVTDMGYLEEPLVGPMSDWSNPVGLVFPKGHTFSEANDADRADFSGTGTVDGGDFGTFSFVYGHSALVCNEGQSCQ